MWWPSHSKELLGNTFFPKPALVGQLEWMKGIVRPMSCAGAHDFWWPLPGCRSKSRELWLLWAVSLDQFLFLYNMRSSFLSFLASRFQSVHCKFSACFWPQSLDLCGILKCPSVGPAPCTALTVLWILEQEIPFPNSGLPDIPLFPWNLSLPQKNLCSWYQD